MKVKVSEATNRQLDFMVAKCNGHLDDETIIRRLEPDEEGWCISYSTDWSQGGPIIEREFMDVFSPVDRKLDEWHVVMPAKRAKDRAQTGFGPTPLIAAMRCLVTSKLGDTGEVPDELCE